MGTSVIVNAMPIYIAAASCYAEFGIPMDSNRLDEYDELVSSIMSFTMFAKDCWAFRSYQSRSQFLIERFAEHEFGLSPVDSYHFIHRLANWTDLWFTADCICMKHPPDYDKIRLLETGVFEITYSENYDARRKEKILFDPRLSMVCELLDRIRSECHTRSCQRGY